MKLPPHQFWIDLLLILLFTWIAGQVLFWTFYLTFRLIDSLI